MGATKELLLRMSEEHFLSIPGEIRERFLNAKRVDSENSDWAENMKDPHFAKLYDELKHAKKHLEERQFQLREERIKNNLNK